MVSPGGVAPAGGSAGALAFLAGLERWTALDRSSPAPALRAALLAHLREAQAGQPASALVHQLAGRALEVADAGVRRGGPPVELRTQLAQSCAAERLDLEAGRAAVARTARALVTERGAWIAALSDSSTVRLALLDLQHAGLGPRALVAEGRPDCAGRAFAAALGGAAIPVWLVVDAALALLLSQATALWLGAEAVTDRGVIAPVGAYAAALAAREHSVPVHVLATRRKCVPAATRTLSIPEMPPGQVWDEPAPGVRPRNVRLEMVPLELLRGVVTEDGMLGPAEIIVAARDRALPEELGGAPGTA